MLEKNRVVCIVDRSSSVAVVVHRHRRRGCMPSSVTVVHCCVWIDRPHRVIIKFWKHLCVLVDRHHWSCACVCASSSFRFLANENRRVSWLRDDQATTTTTTTKPKSAIWQIVKSHEIETNAKNAHAHTSSSYCGDGQWCARNTDLRHQCVSSDLGMDETVVKSANKGVRARNIEKDTSDSSFIIAID